MIDKSLNAKRIANRWPNKVSALEAILRVSDANKFLFRKDCIPEPLEEYLNHWNSICPVNKFLSSARDFHQYSYEYKKGLRLQSLSQVKDDYVIIGSARIKDFYGKRAFRKHYYGMKQMVNTKRMSDLHKLPMDVVRELIQAASAGLWTLEHSPYWGYAINQKTITLPDPIDVIDHNLWISHNLGMLCKLNCMYHPCRIKEDV